MRRRSLPDVEALEGKALLSGAASSSLAVRLTALPEHTSTGTQVVFTLVETNVGQADANVTFGPSTDGFVVSQNGKSVWASNAGIQPLFLQFQTLKPNQSLTLHATWDGRSDLLDPTDPSKEGPPLSGTFTVENQLDQSGHRTTFAIPKTTTHITPPKPPAHHSH